MYRPRSSTFIAPFKIDTWNEDLSKIIREALLAYSGSTTSVHVEQIPNGKLKISIVEAVEYRDA